MESKDFDAKYKKYDISKPFTCKRCGHAFPGGRGLQYCSDACKAAARAERKNPPPAKKKRVTTLEIALAARDAGMSYGDYVATHNV
jgi:hypothetical protein